MLGLQKARTCSRSARKVRSTEPRGLREVLYDGLTCEYAAERAAAVDYGHKVLVQRGGDDVGAFGVDGQGGAEVAADKALDAVALLGLEVGGAGGQDGL